MTAGRQRETGSTRERGRMVERFEATWESLTQFRCPDWFRDAKFGIWSRWASPEN